MKGHRIPKCYGAVEPTAVKLPIETILSNLTLATTEIFGPFQIIVDYKEDQMELIFRIIENMEEHLTAAVVSNDPVFQHQVLSRRCLSF